MALGGGGRGVEPPYKKDRGCSSYLLGVKKTVLLSLRVLSLKRSTAGIFVVPLRVLSRKHMAGDNVLCKELALL